MDKPVEGSKCGQIANCFFLVLQLLPDSQVIQRPALEDDAHDMTRNE